MQRYSTSIETELARPKDDAGGIRRQLEAALASLTAPAAVAGGAFLPLFWAGRRVGRLPRAWLAALAGHPALTARGQGGGLELAGASLAEAMESLGRALRAAGLAPEPRGESIDVFFAGADGPDFSRSACAVERSLCRAFGLWTRAVRATALLPGMTPAAALARPQAPALLLSRRNLRKRIGPGLWDSLAAGMVQAGEAPAEAMRREAFEEAGLAADAFSDAPAPHEARVERAVPEGGFMSEATYEWRIVLAPGWRPESRDGEAAGFAPASAEALLALIERRAIMPEAAAAALRLLLSDVPQR